MGDQRVVITGRLAKLKELLDWDAIELTFQSLEGSGDRAGSETDSVTAADSEDTIKQTSSSYFNDETLLRYLRARNFNVKDAYEQVKHSYKWRCESRPEKTKCSFCAVDCHAHNMRICGIDKDGSPIVYTCFKGAVRRFNLAANMEHLTQLMENMQKLITERRNRTAPVGSADTGKSSEQQEDLTLTPLSEQWVIFVDFLGFGIADCDPRTAVHCAHLLAHYPERLKLIVIVDPPWGWGVLWSACKPFLDARTSSKVRFVSSGNKEQLTDFKLGDEAATWLHAEFQDNRNPDVKHGEKKYWIRPAEKKDGIHDPRGFPSYIGTDAFKHGQHDGAVLRELNS